MQWKYRIQWTREEKKPQPEFKELYLSLLQEQQDRESSPKWIYNKQTNNEAVIEPSFVAYCSSLAVTDCVKEETGPLHQLRPEETRQ